MDQLLLIKQVEYFPDVYIILSYILYILIKISSLSKHEKKFISTCPQIHCS